MEFDVPIIGRSEDVIPTDKVLEAMRTLEAELRVYYVMLMEDAEDKLNKVQALISDNETVAMSELKNIFEERDEVQEEEV
jgi:predicted MPP superfamily phosphohydrolase